MNYAEIKTRDIANGPGVRVSLFVSGCTHRCKGCFNEIAWDFNYGKPFTKDTINYILELIEPNYIKGITVLGGEPFEPQNQIDVLELLWYIRSNHPNKSIWMYTGYLYEDILSGKIGDKKIARNILACLDVLVDGPFIESKKNLSLRFRGSENQRLIDVKKSLGTNDIVIWNDWQDEDNKE